MSDLSELYSPMKRTSWQYEPNHFQLTQNIKKGITGGKAKPKPPRFNMKNPPFGLDYDLSFHDRDVETAATGYKKGGPKEARLFSVALLGGGKEVDHMIPVRVDGIPEMIKEEEIYEVFQRWGEVGDVYIPRNAATRKAIAGFAIVRYEDKRAASACLEQGETQVRSMFSQPLVPTTVTMTSLDKQKSIFSLNSGVNGITNEITDDMKETARVLSQKKESVSQSITLAECLSRSGYPWGSKQELKILESHANPEVMLMSVLKVENLNRYTLPETLQDFFADDETFFLEVGDVYFPRPLQVTLRLNDGTQNDGFGFIRFPDQRDMRRALSAISLGLVKIDGEILAAEEMKPFAWPNDKTRRYC